MPDRDPPALAPAAPATAVDGDRAERNGIDHDRHGTVTAAALLTRCSFPPPASPVVCAFSGGADSSALLVLAAAAGCSVRAVHVDHRLRPDSADAAARAVAIAAARGIDCEVIVVDVGDGPNLEARARTARQAALPAGALTGHTADDQAETLLINLLRGAGTAGLAAIRPGPRHPLLRLRRAETVALCAAAGIEPITDPTNDDRRHLRNRLRHDVLPLLDDVAGRDVAALLARSADVLRDDAELIDALLEPWRARIDPTDATSLAEHPAIGRRLLRAWLAGDGYPPDRATLERAWQVVTGAAVACDLGGGRRLQRSHQRLAIAFPGHAGRT